VLFDRDVTECAYIATLGVGGLSEAIRGGLYVAPRFKKADGVFVNTYDDAAADEDGGFHLAVFCP
jgi:hypothetical protein